MSKDAYYFSHDSNSRNDEKILSLRMELGMEGYGIYWAIVEMLRDSNNYKMQLQCERIAFELHTKSDTIKSVITKYGLFECDGENFWSESLNRRMQLKEEKSNKARESAKVRWDKANAMRTHSDSNASKVKESKEKEKKEKNIIPPSFDMVKIYHKERKTNVDINKFYDHYESVGWNVGKNRMKDWQAAYRKWEPEVNKQIVKPKFQS